MAVPSHPTCTHVTGTAARAGPVLRVLFASVLGRYALLRTLRALVRAAAALGGMETLVPLPPAPPCNPHLPTAHPSARASHLLWAPAAPQLLAEHVHTGPGHPRTPPGSAGPQGRGWQPPLTTQLRADRLRGLGDCRGPVCGKNQGSRGGPVPPSTGCMSAAKKTHVRGVLCKNSVTWPSTVSPARHEHTLGNEPRKTGLLPNTSPHSRDPQLPSSIRSPPFSLSNRTLDLVRAAMHPATGLHFPASPATRGGHVTKFWPMRYTQRVKLSKESGVLWFSGLLAGMQM